MPLAESRPGSDAPPASSAAAPFRYAIFRNVWLANLWSQFGGMIQSVGAAWMMMSIADSPVMVSLVQASTTLPVMMLALAAGALADTFDRRKILIAAQVFMLVVSTLLALAAYLGLITPWLLLLFTFLIGCGAALNGPAWQASVGEMVPREVLPSAVALNSMGFNVARSLGPAVGGMIVAAAGAAAAFATNAVSYIGLIAVLARWRAPFEQDSLPREKLGPAMMAGVRYVAMSPNIRSVLLRSFVFGLGAGAVPALMPLIARDLVGGGPLTYGLLLGAFGIGAVGGAIFTARLRERISNETIARGAMLGFAVAAAVSSVSTSLPLTMAALTLGGMGWVLALATFNVTVQMSAPRWVVARALALYQMAAFGGMAGGSWLWGAVTETAGLPTALLGSAAVLLGCIALGLRFGLPQTEALNLDPLGRWSEPDITLPIKPRSGPVVITIEYRIREQDVGPFLAAMAERRRIRLRDGARHWQLLRDLEDTELWVERYDSPTWIEYVRHNQRITQADADVGARLRALDQGTETKHVRRLIERQPGMLSSGAREMAAPLTDPSRQS
ncbi:MFS transporter [Allosphingosinicella humi]